MRKKYQHRFGMTVTEVMVAVVIIGILVTSSFFILGRIGGHLRLAGTATELKQSISLARQKALELNRQYVIRCFPDSTPQVWWILRVDSAGFFSADPNGMSRDTLHPSVRFGIGSDLGGGGAAAALGPDGKPIPTDGVTFPNNTVPIMPRQGVPTPGVIYLTNRRETQAVVVNAMGSATIMRYVGNGQWR